MNQNWDIKHESVYYEGGMGYFGKVISGLDQN